MHIVLNYELERKPRMVPYPGEKMRGGGIVMDFAKARQYTPVPFNAADGFADHTLTIRKKALVHPQARLISHDFKLAALDDLNYGFLGLLADCYSRHEKLRIQPQDLWYIVLNELAVEINDHPDRYRALFTSSDSKELIAVPSDRPENLPVRMIIETLEAQMPGIKVDWLIPRLSTHTAASETAMAAAVCHMASPYYNYMTYMCGIPVVEVTGTVEDWQAVKNCCIQLGEVFQPINNRLYNYLMSVRAMFEDIASQVGAEQLRKDFWEDIFTTKNVGSGRELLISGWITDFYFKKRDLAKLENFTSACSVVPFTNYESKREFVAVHGAFGVSRDEWNFLTCEYGQLVFETTGLGERPETSEDRDRKEMKAIADKIVERRKVDQR